MKYKMNLTCKICKEPITPQDLGPGAEDGSRAVQHESFGAAHIRHRGVKEEYNRLMNIDINQLLDTWGE